jgi:hypothetical protein
MMVIMRQGVVWAVSAKQFSLKVYFSCFGQVLQSCAKQ